MLSNIFLHEVLDKWFANTVKPRLKRQAMLVRYADDFDSLAPPARLLDMATGSGCIGLTLAAAWKDCRVQLADISEEALDLARMNASRLGLNAVQLVRSDLFEKITGKYDLVTANLPYIPSAEIPALSREVRRDSVLALDGGPDGMDIIRRFLVEVQPCLQPGARIALEVSHDQGREVAALAASQGFTEIRVLPDLAGFERFVLAVSPPIAEVIAPAA